MSHAASEMCIRDSSFTAKRWSASTGVQYVAGLYKSLDPAATEDFVLWNVRAAFRAAHWLEIWVRGENLLAQEYEINAGFPKMCIRDSGTRAYAFSGATG